MKTLYTYQAEAVHTILRHPGFILADECGLGKTVVAVEVCKRLREQAQAQAQEQAQPASAAPAWRSLIIAPPALIPQWRMEILDQDPGVPVTVVNRLPLDFTALQGYFLMSIYDLSSPQVRAALSRVVFNILVLDEAHRIKNRKTKTAQWVKQIAAARRLCLTGTPMEKTPADLWSLLNFVAPDDFPAYWNFVLNNLNVTEGYWERFVIGGPKNPQAFGELLRPYMLRRTKDEVMPQLPEKICIEQVVEMTSHQAAFYHTVKRQHDIVVDVDGLSTLIITNTLTKITRLQQIAVWPPLVVPTAGAESGKLEWLDTFRDDHPNEPMVVFTRFREVAQLVHERYGGDIIIGGLRMISPDPQFCVGTIDAMGEGLNLQWARHAIFLDCHWSSIKMTQAIDRVHRVDIKEPKNLYFLWSCAEDRAVIDAFNAKMSEAELVAYYLRTVLESP